MRVEVDVETGSGSTTKMIPADLDGGHIDEKEDSPEPGSAVCCRHARQSAVDTGSQVKSLDALAESVEVRG